MSPRRKPVDKDPLAEIESPVRAHVRLPTESGTTDAEIKMWLVENEPAELLAQARGMQMEFSKELQSDSAQVQLTLGLQARTAAIAGKAFDLVNKFGLESSRGMEFARMYVHCANAARGHGEGAIKLAREMLALQKERNAAGGDNGSSVLNIEAA